MQRIAWIGVLWTLAAGSSGFALTEDDADGFLELEPEAKIYLNKIGVDSEFLAQAVHFGFKIGDVPVPVRYFDEASSISFRRSMKYGFATLGVVARYWANRLGLWKSRLFAPVESR